MNIEIKKSLSVLELSDLARIIEMQEKDIKLVDLSYEKRLELLLETGLRFQTDKKVHDPESGHNGVYFKCNKSCHHRTDRSWKDLPCMRPWRGSVQTDLQGFVYQDARPDA